MAGPDLYIANSIAAWAVTDTVTEPTPGVARVETQHMTRYLLRRRGIDIAPLLESDPGRRLVVEDSFASPSPALPETVTVKRMPVMVRPAAPTEPKPRPGVEVHRVSTLDELRTAERVIVAGFPIEGEVAEGEFLPDKVLGNPHWHVWLAEHDGVPAAGCFTYDDGASVGVYLLATLAEHRSAGLGRAIMTAAVNQN